MLPQKSYCLETPRLRLRSWQPKDLPEFAQLNANPKVMRHFPHPLSPQESDALATKFSNIDHTKWLGLLGY